jgi:ParB family chromosome partitioning protein
MQTRRLSELIIHPLNSEIYGDSADFELIRSVKAKGVLQPILVDRSNRIISGHRRFDAASKAGLKEVPVELFDSGDEIEISEVLLESNRQRVKTNEQLAREAANWLKIEKEKARLRQAQAGKEKQVPATSPEAAGEARDLAAKKLGIGGKKVEEATAVIEAIDQLKQKGHKKTAERLHSTLNDQSVHRAYREAQAGGVLTVSKARISGPAKRAEQAHLQKRYGKSEHEIAFRRIKQIVAEELGRCPRRSLEGRVAQANDELPGGGA